MADDAVADSNIVHRGRPVYERGFGLNRLGKSLVHNRALIGEMARRELTAMHAGQMAGAVWLIVHPLLIFIVYAFLFTVVFKVRIGAAGPTDYLLYLFSGLAPWLVTQDCLVRSTNVMLANLQIVKKVMFPLEVLVAKTIVSSIVVQSILGLCVFGYAIYVRGLQPSLLLLLPLLAMHLMSILGCGLLLACVTPYLRDLAELVRVFLTLNIYLMPIMYTPSMVPAQLHFVLAANPFSHLIWCYQDVLYFNGVEHPLSWLVLALFSAATLATGSYVFTRLRHFIASTL